MHTHPVKLFLHRMAILLVAFVAATSALVPAAVSAATPAASSSDTTQTTQSTSDQKPADEETETEKTNVTSPATTQSTTSSQSDETTSQTTPDNDNGQSPTVTASTDTPQELSTGNAPATTVNTQTDASIDKEISIDASSGDATGSKNTTVGNISTGTADASATVVNTLQSSVNLNGKQPIVFVHDIDGDVTGNLMIDPEALAKGSGNQTSSLGSNAVPLTSTTNASINNTIGVNAESGDASALMNTTAGDVQTGSATAVANVVNLINSAINANQSFIGVVNIHGNFTGDILVPTSFVHNVLAANPALPAGSADGVPLVETDLNAKVTNTVNASAASGSATTAANTDAGQTSSGNTKTNVTIMNLTGKSVIGKNALLVFVNVLGNWVGLIFDAPAGSTSATLGNGTSSITASQAPIDSTVNLEINNDINVKATSGNANAEKNTTVGNVSSGEAYAGANLLNILNSQLSFSDWFGVLFINVFGNWQGNLAAHTASTPTTGGSGGGNGGGGGSPRPSTGSNAGASAGPDRNVFSFFPANASEQTTRVASAATGMMSSLATTVAIAPESSDQESGKTKGASDAVDNTASQVSLQNDDEQTEASTWLWTAAALIGVATVAAAIRYYTLSRRN